MQIVLFDTPELRTQLFPFTFTRPISEIRVGILTIAEKWSRRLGEPIAYHTEEYLRQKFPQSLQEDLLWINGAVCPDQKLVDRCMSLKEGQGLFFNDHVIAVRGVQFSTLPSTKSDFGDIDWLQFEDDIILIERPWHIFQKNAQQIELDWKLVTAGRESQEMDDPFTKVYNPAKIFVEEGASIKAAILNAETGPIYIGKDAVVQEGALIRGSFALCEGATINIGAKLRGDTTIGPFCKVGGEVSNSLIFGYSNKGHDGFLGNSVIGEWCNLGADTNSSNLKNDYGKVSIWDYASRALTKQDLQFCGLLMGDHSKCGINTMFNTATTVGVSANIFGAGFPSKFIPSFSWGGPEGWQSYRIEKALEVANTMMVRRGKSLDQTEELILRHVAEVTAKYRQNFIQ